MHQIQCYAPKNMKIFLFCLGSLGAMSAAAAETGNLETAQLQSVAEADKTKGELGSLAIESSPLPWLFGIYGAELGIGVSDRVTVGPTLTYVNHKPVLDLSSSRFRGYQAGAKATFYLSDLRYRDSWIASVEAAYTSLTYTSREFLGGLFGNPQREYKADINAFGGALVAGYQWNYRSGINLTLAGGAQFYSSSKTQLASSGADERPVEIPAFSGVSPALRLNVGYVF